MKVNEACGSRVSAPELPERPTVRLPPRLLTVLDVLAPFVLEPLLHAAIRPPAPTAAAPCRNWRRPRAALEVSALLPSDRSTEITLPSNRSPSMDIARRQACI